MIPTYLDQENSSRIIWSIRAITKLGERTFFGSIKIIIDQSEVGGHKGGMAENKGVRHTIAFRRG